MIYPRTRPAAHGTGADIALLVTNRLLARGVWVRGVPEVPPGNREIPMVPVKPRGQNMNEQSHHPGSQRSFGNIAPAPWREEVAAGLTLAAAQLHQLFREVDLAALRETLQEKPAEYARLVLALVKIHESGLRLEKQRTDEARVQLELDFEPKRPAGLTPDVLGEIERELNLF